MLLCMGYVNQDWVAAVNTVIAKRREAGREPATEPAAGRRRTCDPAAPLRGIVHVTSLAKRLCDARQVGGQPVEGAPGPMAARGSRSPHK